MSWLLGTVLCHLLLMHGGHADFGVPYPVLDSWQVEFTANQLRDALNDVAGSLQRIPVVLLSESAQESAKIITELVKNVGELGRNVSEKYAKAAKEANSTEEVFATLHNSSNVFKLFIENNSSSFLTKLSLQTGNTSVEEFKLALTNINNATVKTEEAAKRLQDGIRNSPNDWILLGEITRGLASSIGELRDQVKNLRTTVDITVNTIQTVNSLLENVKNMQVSTGNGLNSSLEELSKTIDNESKNAIIKYQNGVKNINNELAGAVKRLTMYNSDKTLWKLQDSISESFTRTYYDLFNRDEQDVSTIKQAYQALGSNMSDLLQSTSQPLFTDIQTTADSLASMILVRSTSSERCNSMLGPRISGTFGSMQNEIASCINRERGRLSRIADSVDKVMQLLQITSADFAADIGSCSRFGAFGTDRADFARAKGCLETNLRELKRYDQEINSMLTLLQPSIQLETDASRFRMHLCVTQSTDELRSLMEDTRQVLGTCVDTVA